MKISLDWLRDFVTWEDAPGELAAKLTAAGLNVEAIEPYVQTFPGVVVARVLACEKHPNADRLSLCRVDAGQDEPVQVVCGAPNVREGLDVLFASVGSVLPGDFRIKKTKIRGVESHGMICSSAELQLAADAAGIMELDDAPPPGTPADVIFGYDDVVLDIEVTPNRPDWLSHLGVAREVAAIYGTKVSTPPGWSSQQSGESLGFKVRIDDYADCPRYSAYGAQDVQIGPSPRFMQNRLRAVGMRPINNVVDITNYVMLELGQPMHAFDRSKLSGSVITIRRGDAGQKVVTLDDAERELAADTLLVCDEKGPVALAGVMGLANSEVDEGTRDVILESAFFDPMLVRRASREQNLISESSYRFERGADWDMIGRAAHRALHLFQEHAGAHIIPDWADRRDPDHQPAAAVPLRIWQVNRLLGTEISTDDAAQYLQALGLKVQPMGNPGSSNASAVNMMVQVPSFRRDLFQEVDLIEEIARVHGYDRVSGGGGFRGSQGATRRLIDTVLATTRQWFAGRGFHEIVTSTFFADGDLERLKLDDDDVRANSLTVINPHHGGDTQLRTSLLPSLLDVVRRNLNAGAEAPVRFFQFHRVYWPAGRKAADSRHDDERLLPQEPFVLQFAVGGRKQTGMGGVPADLLEIKGMLEDLAVVWRRSLVMEEPGDEGTLEPGARWRILDAEGRIVGAAGRVAATLLQDFDLDAPVALAEISLDDLDLTPEEVVYEDFSRYPAVRRDLSLVVPDGVRFGQLAEVVRDTGSEHLRDLELFDIYRGKGVPDGASAMGIRLKFRSAKGNLKGKTVDQAISRIVAALADRLHIEHRSQD